MRDASGPRPLGNEAPEPRIHGGLRTRSYRVAGLNAEPSLVVTDRLCGLW